MIHWRGYFETFQEVDAETEEEAIEKIAAKIADVLRLERPTSIVCWEVEK